MRSLLYILLFLTPSICLIGQTCCTAGATLSSAIGIQNPNAGIFAVELNYEYKSINALIDNNEVLQNDPRSRFGQNFLIKTDYAFNDKWAMSLLIPFVQQGRQTISESQSSFGLGDISLIVQRSFLSSNQNAFLSAGIKFPTGITSHLGDAGIFLSADMQSGSGSIDYFIGGAYQRPNFLINLLGLDFASVYRINTTNPNFASTDNFPGRRFAFGDEFVNTLRLTYQLVKSSGFFIPELALKFRYSQANEEQSVTAPNSGGTWLSVPFGLSYVPDLGRTWRLFAELPIYQNLTGLQISNNFSFGASFIFQLNQKNNEPDINF